MERLSSNRRPTGITINALRAWGMLFMMAGVLGRGVMQTHILGLPGMDSQQLLAALETSSQVMAFASISLVLQAMEVCAAPIFALLLADGFAHTSDRKAYFLRVLGTAVLSEIPYNLAVGGKLLDLSSRNPVFSIVLSMVVLFIFHRYRQRGVKNVLIKCVVVIAAFVWARMLNIEFGAPVVVLVLILWGLRSKPGFRVYAGASAAIACSLFSPFFLLSPMAFLAIHMCNGEKGEENRLVNYLIYPALLLVIGIACTILF